MSEPIQSIAQNNYILHNIDAKKLYVQEPLFTANSGDAVYVGWRPDETVLWSGAAQWKENPTFNLSEPASNFEYIEFHFTPYNDGLRASVSQRFIQSNLEYDVNGVGFFGTSGLRFNRARVKNSDNNATALNMTDTIELTVSQNSTSWNIANAAMTKIVGINRKENV